MPSCTLIDESVVLTTAGWAAILRLSSPAEVFGVDRCGKITARTVVVESADQTCPAAYVGTAACFGTFSPKTHLTTRDGKRWQVGRVVEEGNIVELGFEGVGRFPDSCAPALFADAVWHSLVGAAVTSSESGLRLRCRYNDSIPAETVPFLKPVKIGRNSYADIDQSTFRAACGGDWAGSTIAIGKLWLHEIEQDAGELEREFFLFGLWYCAALLSKNRGYRLQYDCLQHSSFVFIASADAPPAPVERGACAFLTPESRRGMRLTWPDASWNPLSAGFILGPD